MADSLTNISSALYTRLRGDKNSPAVSDVDLGSGSVQVWINQIAPTVSEMLRGKPEHLQGISTTSALVLSGSPSYAALPSDFHFETGLQFLSGSSYLGCRQITYSPHRFFTMDSSNFLLTPQTNEPMALISAGQITSKPNYTAGVLHYVKYHPAISSVQDTLWSDLADKVLIELLAAKYYEYQANSAEPEIWLGLMQTALNNARELSYGVSGQRNPEQSQA